MELCIRRAHTHPLGVLWYSTVDSVVFFNNIADVNRTQQVLLDVPEFHDEAIATQTMAPMQAHITAFIEMWYSNPAALGRGNCILLPIEHLLTRRHCITYMHSWVI